MRCAKHFRELQRESHENFTGGGSSPAFVDTELRVFHPSLELGGADPADVRLPSPSFQRRPMTEATRYGSTARAVWLSMTLWRSCRFGDLRAAKNMKTRRFFLDETKRAARNHADRTLSDVGIERVLFLQLP